MRLPIYLDNAATTPIDPRVVEAMLPYLTEHFGNASSQHAYGRQAAHAIETARQQVASLIHAQASDIVWTSGATEAINLAIKGTAYAAYAKRHQGKHIVTCLTEHSATLDSCRYLETQGFAVTYLAPEQNGLLDVTQLTNALRPDTILVSMMQVNNETGVIQNIQAMSELTAERNIVLHVDAAQSVGKVAIDVKRCLIDLMSFSAHKLYGPKGIGALYVKPQTLLQPLLHGGGHEDQLRSGTLPTHQIVGMGTAFALAAQHLVSDNARIQHLREQLWQGLALLGDVIRNGDSTACVSGILNVSFIGLHHETLLPALRELVVSTGSACHAAATEPSHVLTGMGLSKEMANSSVRFSLGRFTTEEEVKFALEKIQQVVKLLRSL